MVLTAAYGRIYKSKKAVVADFEAGKDFIINDITSRWNGKMISIRDFKDGEEIEFRYNGDRNVSVYTVKK